MNVIVPALDQLTKAYIAAFDQYMVSSIAINRAKFGIYITAIVLGFLVLWLPYLTRLSTRIWKVKGMLNMIPMEMIMKNEKLKTKLLAGDFLAGVR